MRYRTLETQPDTNRARAAKRRFGDGDDVVDVVVGVLEEGSREKSMDSLSSYDDEALSKEDTIIDMLILSSDMLIDIDMYNYWYAYDI